MPRQRQTLLFSATMPAEIRRLADQWLQNPVEVSVAAHSTPAERIEQSIIGIRSVIGRGTRLSRVIMMGADYYDDTPRDSIPIGIGAGCVIEGAIIDKNARIGDNVRISPAGKQEDVDHALYYVRDGVVIIPKNGVIPHGMVI